MKPIIYVVDDDPMMLNFLHKVLSKTCVVKTFISPKVCLESIQQSSPMAVVADLFMPEMNGLELYREAKRIDESLPFVMVTSESKVEVAAEAMREGFVDYIIKPIDADEFQSRVKRAIEISRSRRFIHMIRSEQERQFSLHALGGTSKYIKMVREQAMLENAHIPKITIITGPSGQGKRFCAEVLRQSRLDDRLPEDTLDCSSLAQVSNLFGNKELYSNLDYDKDVIIIHLPEKLESNFRQDFAHYLCKILHLPQSVSVIITTESEDCSIMNIELFSEYLANENKKIFQKALKQATIIEATSLEKRKSDIVLIAQKIMEQLCISYQAVATLPPNIVNELEKHSWQGGTAELRAVCERAVLLQFHGVSPEDSFILSKNSALTSDSNSTFSIPANLKLKDVQKEYVRATMANNHGNLEDAASTLGVSRKTLWEIRKKHNLT